VYDVTNVLCSLNLIGKKTIPKDQAIKAELENNIDCPSNMDFGDFGDDGDSLASGRKSGRAARTSEKSDTKVLEWTSFLPSVIRQKYLERMSMGQAIKTELQSSLHS
jgi:hypothetical protein